MFILQLCQWLNATEWSVALRESTWVYPIIESIHVLSLCLFLGFAVVLDLRLIGVAMRKTRVSEIAERLMPWTVTGFIIMVISGALLFYSAPVRFYGNVFFRVKAVMLLLAGLNAWIFHATVFRRLPTWDDAAITPTAARLAGSVSLALWAVIVVAGRMIAYNWFD
jgi:hypothetical protein